MSFLLKVSFLLALVVGLTSCNTVQIKTLDDQAGLLTQEQRNEMSGLIEIHNKSGPGKLLVRTIKSLPPDTSVEKYAYSMELENRKTPTAKNNNVVVVVALTDRKMRIEVSPNMQPLLTDSYCQHVVSDIMVPQFRHEKYYEGIQAGIDELIRHLEGKNV